MERQKAVSMKISKYLLKADDLYQNHLVTSDGEQVAWNRWGVSGYCCCVVVANCRCFVTTTTECELCFVAFILLLRDTRISFWMKNERNREI